MKTLRIFTLLSVFLLFLFASISYAGDATNGGVDPSQVRQLQEQMLSSPEIMEMVSSLQNEPEVRELLNDPKLMEAVQNGDTAALVSDPRFLKLLENPKVQEIVKQIR